jgi:muramoyltetrapeptide carboxypeptidase
MRRTIVSGSRLDHALGIVAPASAVNQKALDSSLKRFARWGIPVAVADQVRSTHRYFAGPDESRAEALDAMARDPQVGTLWCARGGFGCTRLLPYLDQWKTAAALARSPKLLIGYSDITALHLYLYHKLKLPSLHAVMPGTLRFAALPAREDRLLRTILAGELALGKKSYTSEWRSRALLPGRGDTEGVILGGNLTLLVNLIGTPWQPDLRGALLFLEDCAEQPYRVDRMLTQLANAGMLRGLRGVLLGDFEADVAYKDALERKYWKEIFLERFSPLGIPVLDRLPVGHGKRNEPLPLGVRAVVTRTGKLLLLEQVVVARRRPY